MDLEQNLQQQAATAHAAIDRAVGAVRDEVDRAAHGLGRAGAYMRGSTRRAVRRSREWGSEAGDYVRSHPYASTGALVGVLAVVAGILLLQRRR